MFNKSKYLLMFITLLLVTCVTGGLSAWIFTNSSGASSSVSTSGDSQNNAFSDGIKENYTFGQTKVGTEYVYYFFPSTLYLQFYNEGYKQPENIFGYNEVVLNDVGDPLYVNGKVQYKVVDFKKSSVTTYYRDRESYRDWETLSWRYRWSDKWEIDNNTSSVELDSDELEKFIIDKKLTEIDGEENFYADTDNIIKDPNDYERQYAYFVEEIKHFNYGGSAYDSYYDFMVNYLNSVSSSYKFDYSSSNSSSTSISRNDPYVINTDNYGGQESSAKKEYYSPVRNNNDYGLNLKLPSGNLVSSFRNPNNYSEVYNFSSNNLLNIRRYRNDRFGGWTSFYDLDYVEENVNEAVDNSSGMQEGEGNRYLPIKISVTGSLNPDVFKNILPQLVCATYDDHVWFDYTSNVWTYVPDNDASKSEYKLAKDGFTAKDLIYIFDIMQNPNQYAVSEDIDGDGVEENVIRLYPVFSNGKNAKAGLTDGGRDALRANFDYNSSYESNHSSEMLPSEIKLTYSNEYKQVQNNGYTSDLNYAILKNLNLEKNKYDSIVFEIALCYDANRWGNDWYQTYTLSSTYINYLIDAYGEGLYTFYMIVGDSTTEKNHSPDDIWSSTSKNGFLFDTLTNDSTSFKSLYKKNLMYINPNGTISNDDLTDENTLTDYTPLFITGAAADSHNNVKRPLCLMVEKVTSMRLVKDIPLDGYVNSTDGINYSPNNGMSFTWGSNIDSTISTIYSGSDIFVNSNHLYGFNDDAIFNNGEKNYNISGEDISESNPYIYVIQNADFRNVSNLFFQIRFGSSYISNAMTINVGGGSDYKYYAFRYGYLKENNEYKPVYRFFQRQSDIFTSTESNYYIQKVNVTDSDNSTRIGLKLKDNTAKGVYDILLVRDLSVSDSFVFNMYIYRQKIDFVKVFNKDPGTYTDSETGLEFINHSSNASTSSATLLRENSFFLGDVLSTASKGSDESGTTLKNAILNYIGTDKKTVYTLNDAVTKEPIAYIENGKIYGINGTADSQNDIDLFTLAKNYVLYLSPMQSTSTLTTTPSA